MNTKATTKVISFRVPVDFFNQVDKAARKQKQKRAEFVETLFTPAFEQHVEQNGSKKVSSKVK